MSLSKLDKFPSSAFLIFYQSAVLENDAAQEKTWETIGDGCSLAGHLKLVKPFSGGGLRPPHPPFYPNLTY